VEKTTSGPGVCVARCRKQLLFGLTFASIGLILTGAKEATFELRDRPAHLNAAVQDVRAWGCTLISESDAAPAGLASVACGFDDAVELVKACSQRLPAE